MKVGREKSMGFIFHSNIDRKKIGSYIERQ